MNGLSYCILYDPVIKMNKLVPSTDTQYIAKINYNDSVGYRNKIKSAINE